MFTLPPLPPKDYVLKDVNQNERSVQEFTPVALPRITQSNLAKFCAPVPYQDRETLAHFRIDYSVNPQVVERWTDKARAFWVDKPGKNDYFVHDIFKKYTVQVMDSYDDRFKHNERVFYRSFKYELECMEAERLKKLYRKIEREEKEERMKNKIIEEKHKMGVQSCKATPPFWWGKDVCEEASSKEAVSDLKVDVSYDRTNLRWQDEPVLTEYVKANPCRRRADMALIGMPFRSEACNWYHKNYPPANIRFVHKKFS